MKSVPTKARSRVASSGANRDPREHFKKHLIRRFVVRFHMTLILAALGASGILASKILLALGVRSMLERYIIAVALSYALFFLFIKLWLMYVSPPTPRRSLGSIDIGNSLDIGDISVDLGGKGASAAGQAFGGGGDFGGGGATDMWGSAVESPVMSSSSIGGRSGGGSGGGFGGFDFDFDLGDEGIVLILLALLLIVIFGAGVYLVYAAPEILSEAAFQAVLAAGLIKASKKMDGPGWMGSVFKATWIPFVIVLVMAGILGGVAQARYPHATRLADIFNKPHPENRQLPPSR